MKTDLINRIKKGKYDKCYLKTSVVKGLNNAFVINKMHLSVHISDDQKINENWTIELSGVIQYHNLIAISYLPYFHISIEENHPLLWNYQFDRVECKLKGIKKLNEKSTNELIGELATSYNEHTYGFLRFETNPLLNPIRNSDGDRLFFTNQKVIEITESIFNKYNITLENKQVITGKQIGLAHKPKAKVLLFRNPFISSAKMIRGQSYIVADEIKFENK